MQFVDALKFINKNNGGTMHYEFVKFIVFNYYYYRLFKMLSLFQYLK